MESRTPLKELNGTNISRDDADKFKDLYSKSRELANNGDVKTALKYAKQAYQIFKSEKLAKKMRKMEEWLMNQSSDGDEAADDLGDEVVHAGDGFHLYKPLYEKIFSHQREGVLWFWKLFKMKKGGILGDDMGLGKTIQVIAFLSGMFDTRRVHSVLIVLPVSVIINWEREFEKWAPGIRVDAFHSADKRTRERLLAKNHIKGGVILTSYGMLVNNAPVLAKYNGRDYTWDYVILDEGHKIKNPSNKCSKGVHQIPAKNRIILTGTPIQNNLKELWSLFDWTSQGSLLGTYRTFKIEFEGPINRARQKDSTPGEQRLGQQISDTLKNIIAPYFLRRTKATVKETEKHIKDDNIAVMPEMTRKNDLIVWLYLSEAQKDIYHQFLNTDDVKLLLNSTRSPLVALTVLKKICDHPRLLSTKQCRKLGLFMNVSLGSDESSDEEGTNASRDSTPQNISIIPDETLIEESGKMVFLVELLDNLKENNHRCLVFSQSRKVLDIIQKVITNRGHRVCRLDGTITRMSEREDVIKRFSTLPVYSVMLLTTQVGGVGLTITAADRVVIFDPHWNPATDAQAVDRVFRIGQDKNVIIYRLITCGSIEEKIYRRQIFKDSVTKQTTGESYNPFRYFSRQELRELFVLDDTRTSSTQVQLNAMHTHDRKTDENLDEHIAYLHSLDMFGLSDHDLMFNQEGYISSDDEAEAQQLYIEERSKKAEELIALECHENIQMTKLHGKYESHEVFKTKPPAAGPRERPDRSLMPPFPPQNGEPRSLKYSPRQDTSTDDSSDSDSSEDSMLQKTYNDNRVNTYTPLTDSEEEKDDVKPSHANKAETDVIGKMNGLNEKSILKSMTSSIQDIKDQYHKIISDSEDEISSVQSNSCQVVSDSEEECQIINNQAEAQIKKNRYTLPTDSEDEETSQKNCLSSYTNEQESWSPKEILNNDGLEASMSDSIMSNTGCNKHSSSIERLGKSLSNSMFINDDDQHSYKSLLNKTNEQCDQVRHHSSFTQTGQPRHHEVNNHSNSTRLSSDNKHLNHQPCGSKLSGDTVKDAIYDSNEEEEGKEEISIRNEESDKEENRENDGEENKESDTEGNENCDMEGSVESEEEGSVESGDELTAEEEANYIRCVDQAKIEYKSQNYMSAFQLVMRALSIYSEDENLQRFALKLRKKLAKS